MESINLGIEPVASPTAVCLDQYGIGDYSPGAPLWKQLAWFFVGDWLVKTRLLPASVLKVKVLRLFGAKIGRGVRIKPGVQIKFPWRLTIGNHCWIGENAWIDNIASVNIADHVCISQGVYLCTGNHNWSDPSFELRLGTITLESGCWIAAKSVVGPGVTVGKEAILTLGSVTAKSLEPMTIYAGSPAAALKTRRLKQA